MNQHAMRAQNASPLAPSLPVAALFEEATDEFENVGYEAADPTLLAAIWGEPMVALGEDRP